VNRSVINVFPPSSENVRRVYWIGAWIYQAIESILGDRYITIAILPAHSVFIGIKINYRFLMMEYCDSRLKYYEDSVYTIIELADPNAIEQLQRMVTRTLKG